MTVHQCREAVGPAIQGQPDQILVTEKRERSSICCATRHLEGKEPRRLIPVG
jgi:hypothetical protein